MKKIFSLLAIILLVTAFCSIKASAQTISSYWFSVHCSSIDSIVISVSGCTTGDSIVDFYGDGTTDTIPVVCSGGSGTTYGFGHTYAAYGIYSIKFVLLSGGIAVDSVDHISATITCNQVYIFAYNDINGDCVYDSGDVGIYWGAGNIEVDSAGIPVDTIPYIYSRYYDNIYAPSGTIYSFRVISFPPGFTPSCPVSDIIYDTIGSPLNQHDIGFTCSSAAFDLAVGAGFSAGRFGAYSHVILTNSNCTSTDDTLTVTFSPSYSFSYFYSNSATTLPYTVSGNTLTIYVGSAVSASSPMTFDIYFTALTALTIGDTVHSSFTLKPFTGDIDTLNNVVNLIDTIYESYDPNDMSVTPPGTITAGTMLTYMISFENTGNDTAFNIHIMDTLSNYLDIKSFKALSSSAAMNMIPVNDGSNNIIKFDFPGINLLDSTHHGKCDGMVTFSINSLTSLAPGTKIDNHAGIYFDDNPVVMTNNVENIIGTPTTGITSISNVSAINIYPNPTTDVFNITGVQENTNYRLLDITSMCIQRGILNQGSNTLSMKTFAPGIYILEMTRVGGERSMMKVEKE